MPNEPIVKPGEPTEGDEYNPGEFSAIYDDEFDPIRGALMSAYMDAKTPEESRRRYAAVRAHSDKRMIERKQEAALFDTFMRATTPEEKKRTYAAWDALQKENLAHAAEPTDAEIEKALQNPDPYWFGARREPSDDEVD